MSAVPLASGGSRARPEPAGARAAERTHMRRLKLGRRNTPQSEGTPPGAYVCGGAVFYRYEKDKTATALPRGQAFLRFGAGENALDGRAQAIPCGRVCRAVFPTAAAVLMGVCFCSVQSHTPPRGSRCRPPQSAAAGKIPLPFEKTGAFAANPRKYRLPTTAVYVKIYMIRNNLKGRFL